MAVVTLDGTRFGIATLTRRKAMAVEEDGRAARSRAIAAAARARAANGDAELACLGLGADEVARLARRAKIDAFGLWWMALFFALFAAGATAMIGKSSLEGLARGDWTPILVGAVIEALVLACAGALAYGLFARNTFGMTDDIARLADSQSVTLSVGEGRLYLTGTEDCGAVREIRYDALGSVRDDHGRIALCDRAGRIVFDMGTAPRIDGPSTRERVAAAVAEIRGRIPDLPAAA